MFTPTYRGQLISKSKPIMFRGGGILRHLQLKSLRKTTCKIIMQQKAFADEQTAPSSNQNESYILTNWSYDGWADDVIHSTTQLYNTQFMQTSATGPPSGRVSITSILWCREIRRDPQISGWGPHGKGVKVRGEQVGRKEIVYLSINIYENFLRKLLNE